MAPLGPPETPVRSVPLIVPVGRPVPSVQVNSRGDWYTFHAAGGGNLLQLQMKGATPGDTDAVDVESLSGRLGVLRFQPQRAAADFVPRVGMVLGERRRAAFEWAGLSCPGGESVEFEALPGREGVEYRNNTGVPTAHRLVVRFADGEAELGGTQLFGPLQVPAGGAQRVLIEQTETDVQLRSELDLDRDGTPEQVAIVRGVTCGDISNPFLEDADGDGVPDACEAAAVGDFDVDGDIDGADFRLMQACLTGPGTSTPSPACRNADLSRDGDVDLEDCALLLPCFSGEGAGSRCAP